VETGGAIATQPIPSPDGGTVYVGTLAGDLVAVRLDGTLGWKTHLGDRVYSAPCVDKSGTLFLGSDAKQFYAIAPDGKIRWKLAVDDDADTAPVLRDDGSVVFAAGRDVIAVSPTGTVLSRFHAKRKVFTAPALHPDGFVVVGSQDNRVYAIDARGEAVWSTELGADVDGAPVIGDDGSIFVGTDGDEVVKLSARGAILFRTRLGGYVRGPLSLSRNGDVLAGVYGPTPRQVRLRETDGALLGAFSVAGTGARDFGVHGGALEDDDGTLYFGAQDDRIYAVDRQGSLLWSHSTGGDVDAPPTLLPDGRLIVASDDGTVYCFGR
jgi:outer membrane protein assembly factor BamB